MSEALFGIPTFRELIIKSLSPFALLRVSVWVRISFPLLPFRFSRALNDIVHLFPIEMFYKTNGKLYGDCTHAEELHPARKDLRAWVEANKSALEQTWSGGAVN